MSAVALTQVCLDPTASGGYERRLPYTILSLAVVLAWLPLVHRYYPVYDDFTLSTYMHHGVREYFRYQYHENGIWRIIGILIMIAFARATMAYGAMVIVLHLLASWMFLALLRVYFGKRRLTLFAALIFGVWPFAAGALTWAAAVTLIFVEVLFLLTLLTLARWGDDSSRQGLVFIICFLAALLAQLVQENLLLAFLVSGTYVWLMQPWRTGRTSIIP